MEAGHTFTQVTRPCRTLTQHWTAPGTIMMPVPAALMRGTARHRATQVRQAPATPPAAPVYLPKAIRPSCASRTAAIHGTPAVAGQTHLIERKRSYTIWLRRQEWSEAPFSMTVLRFHSGREYQLHLHWMTITLTAAQQPKPG